MSWSVGVARHVFTVTYQCLKVPVCVLGQRAWEDGRDTGGVGGGRGGGHASTSANEENSLTL